MALSSKKTIAKNTGFLYIRTFIVLVVSLWTSRVILQSLGVEDYGIYSAVGGLVSMFTVLTGSMSASISRYITYELGTGKIEKLKQIFSASLLTQLLFIIIVVVVAETMGLWFLNNEMIIPKDRSFAANCVYQCTIIIFCFDLFAIPYNAELIAHEHMKTYAYVSIVDNLFRLIIAYVIFVSPLDKLIFYSLLMALLSLAVRVFYPWYCKRKFEECQKVIVKGIDKANFIGLFNFAGWNILGEVSTISSSHGIGLLLNVFFGPLINAAYGIASQINSAVLAFSNNFTTALAPSITKSYAEKQMDYMRDLVYLGARYSYYLLFLLVLPIIMETETILTIWLKEVPEYSIEFVKLLLVHSLITILSQTIIRAVQATGDIKKYQIIISCVSLLSLPISYIALRFGLNPSIALIPLVAVAFGTFVVRLLIVRPLIGITLKDFITKVLVRLAMVTIIAPVIPVVLKKTLNEGLVSSIIVCAASVLFVGVTCVYIGVTPSEREQLINKLRVFIK